MNRVQRSPDRRQVDALEYLHILGGAVMSSDWTTGAGRHTKARTVPPFCERITRAQLRGGKLPKRITAIFAQHPRCQSVIAITDMRTARRYLREFGRLPDTD